MTIIFLVAGCSTPKAAPDPLEGWKGLGTAHVKGCPFGPVVMDDYKQYIRSLAPEESSSVDDFDIRFYEGRAGQRAVEISIPLHGTWWKHVLFYDKTGERTNTIKYASGSYMS